MDFASRVYFNLAKPVFRILIAVAGLVNTFTVMKLSKISLSDIDNISWSNISINIGFQFKFFGQTTDFQDKFGDPRQKKSAARSQDLI